MKLNVLFPQAPAVCIEDVLSVELPGSKGRFEVLTGHAPIITLLDEGSVRYALKGKDGSRGEEKQISVKGGFAEVRDDEITVCAD